MGQKEDGWFDHKYLSLLTSPPCRHYYHTYYLSAYYPTSIATRSMNGKICLMDWGVVHVAQSLNSDNLNIWLILVFSMEPNVSVYNYIPGFLILFHL